MTDGRQLLRERLGLGTLICCHVVVCCISLICAAYLHPVYHVLYDPSLWLIPATAVAGFTLVGMLFAFAEFSFGYFVGFYFFSMVA